MTNYDSTTLKEAHEASIRNKESVLGSSICGCFSCMETFPPSEAAFYVEADGQETALCPFCDMDAVIGDASGFPVTKEFLKRMNKAWF